MADDQASAKPLVRVDVPAPGHDGVALVTLDRPEALNALDFELLRQLVVALRALDEDDACRAIVVTGSGRRPSPRAPTSRSSPSRRSVEPVRRGPLRAAGTSWRVRKPLIAAVRGHALGGGCELAMLCDLLVAGEDARFGQPEIHLGVMPGRGRHPAPDARPSASPRRWT